MPAQAEPRTELKGWITEDATRRLLSAAGQDLDKLVAAARSRSFKPVSLGFRTSIAFDTDISRIRSANVAGLLRGSDPALADQVIIYSAHHDHLGMAAPDNDDDAGARQSDRIYNGALDNAAGCAQVLAIARAIAALPEKPRRSTLILFVASEEQGLIGSAYYAQNPTFAPGNIVANINYDVGNIWGASKDVAMIGSGKSSLDQVAQRAAAWQGRIAKPEQFPDRGSYYRSDQFSFAKIGVPTLFFGSGTDFPGHPPGWGKQQIEQYELTRYHHPSDEIDDSWSFEGMVQDAQLGFYAGWIIDRADSLPQWNPGDDFEAARKSALSEVQAQRRERAGGSSDGR